MLQQSAGRSCFQSRLGKGGRCQWRIQDGPQKQTSQEANLHGHVTSYACWEEADPYPCGQTCVKTLPSPYFVCGRCRFYLFCVNCASTVVVVWLKPEIFMRRIDFLLFYPDIIIKKQKKKSLSQTTISNRYCIPGSTATYNC